VTSISSSLTTTLSSQLFSKIDTNADSSVSKEEFLAGRPDAVGETEAAALFDGIDSDGSGGISDAEFETHFEEKAGGAEPTGNLSSELLGTILDLLSGGDASAEDDGGSGFMDAAELFASMDSDGDGAVTEAEFTASRPENMTEEQAVALFNDIDTEGSGAISQAQFEAALTPQAGAQAAGAAAAPPAGGGGSSEESYDPLDTNQDGVVDLQELMAGASGSSDEAADTAESDLARRVLQQLEKAVEAYAAAGRDGRDRSAEVLTDA